MLDINGQPRYTINESSQTLAIVRRFGGMIPIVGDIIELIVMFFKYHFNVTDATSRQVVGKYQKTKLFGDPSA